MTLGLLISLITVAVVELTIRKYWIAWALSAVNQILWFWLIASSGQWGLLPLNLYMVYQGIRGARRWRREANNEA
jgi:hypothetical protein